MGETKRITIEDILGDFGFRVKWSVIDHWADVEVYEITSRGGDENYNIPYFHKKDSPCPDDVETIEEAETYLDGFVKWDGCSELNMGQPHWCGFDDYKKHCDLLNYIWKRAFELMGREQP